MSGFANGRLVFRGVLGFLVMSFIGGLGMPAQRGGITLAAQTSTVQPLSANDVSWLFPAPTRAEDGISMADLDVPNAQDPAKRDLVWSDAIFKNFLAIAASPLAQVAGTPTRMSLPVESQSLNNWFIAGVRIDPGAPGLTADIRGAFGQAPQIRLIVQPVRRNQDGSIQPLDIAAHLIFNFVSGTDDPAQPGCAQRFVPDLVAFKAIVADLAALRTKLADGELGSRVSTVGLPLGVHPGLSDPATANGVRRELKAFLERHISSDRLTAMAVMGLPSPASEPWIFLAMAKVPAGAVPGLPTGGFVPVPSPTLDGQQFAQMLEFFGSGLRVVPQPHTNNMSPITCNNAAVSPANLPPDVRRGSSTAELFVTPPPSSDNIKAILDRIADPTRSHFFNTDCVSCHTDTQRAMSLLSATAIPGIDPTLLRLDDWNVRNFGWTRQGEPTVTRRTAAETAAVVAFINSEMLGQ